MKLTRPILGLIIVMSSLSISSIFIEEKVKFKNKSVSVFKDGSGFFIKNADLKKYNKKRLYLDEDLPKALLGTFWFFSKNENLAGVSSFSDTIHSFKERELKAKDLRSILNKNIGKRVEVLYKRTLGSESIERRVSGRLLWFEGDLISLESKDNMFLTINYREILNLRFEEKPTYESVERVEDISYKPVLQIDFFDKLEKDQLEMMYLTKGITWIPGYFIELQKNNKAKIILRSTLINDAEDIENSDVNFVVGVPNFKYATELSPLYGSKEVSKFIGKIDLNYQPLNSMNLNQFSNSIRSYQNNSNFVPVENHSTNTETIKSIEANQSQDMFFYTAKNVSLKKGGRGFYDIFEINCPVAHEYTCNLKTSGYGLRGSWRHLNLGRQSEIPVHHSLKIANKSDFPFTTGTALLVSSENGQLEPLSQDRVKYTPKGGTLHLPMTEAIDVFVSEDLTTKKKQERKKRYPYKTDNAPWYDLVTVKGKITIENHKPEAAKINIHKTIFGEIVDLPASGKLKKKAKVPRHINDENDIRFEIDVAAKSKQVIDFTYNTYILN
ncbi:MAG: hypothetical protein MRY83_01210 [Flavobacteriales bacterium]|nr:hypothetical protein [Flavobacteriales bacterium]